MAQKVNVNRSVQDPFYRYKMPRIIAKVEGKGNGIKTVIANMPEVAKALSRPPTYPTKYFGCELGAQTNFDLKNERYIVNGEHDANKLQDLLDGFIRKFVLCPACENPETVLTVKKQIIHAKCKACGHGYQMDPKQKLSTYILKNPPTLENGEAEKETPNKENGSPPNEEAAKEILLTENNSGNGSLDDDDDWAPEVEGENTEKLSGEMSKMVVDKDLEKSLEERLDMLYQYFEKAVQDGTIQDGKKMLNEAERLELKTRAALLLANMIFTEDVVTQIKQYRNLLLRFCLNDKKAQRYLLGGIEQFVHKKRGVLLSKTAHIIKALYDNDICEEEVIMSWGSKPSGKFVSKDFVKEMIKVAQPVLKWLEEAEEGSDEEEDDDKDLAVAFDDRSRAVGQTVVVEKPQKATGVVGDEVVKDKNNKNAATAKEANHEENDIDIDDI